MREARFHEELAARVEKRSTKAAVAKAAVNKEWVMRELVENLETHKGQNGAVVNALYANLESEVMLELHIDVSATNR